MKVVLWHNGQLNTLVRFSAMVNERLDDAMTSLAPLRRERARDQVEGHESLFRFLQIHIAREAIFKKIIAICDYEDYDDDFLNPLP